VLLPLLVVALRLVVVALLVLARLNLAQDPQVPALASECLGMCCDVKQVRVLQL
jgi:hypothetical protein